MAADPRIRWNRYAAKPQVRASRRTYQKDRYEALKALGLCVKCKDPARPGRVSCEAHR